ncbi:MAG: site-specific DNA-methyltransferase [Anaerolineae bacterium]|nr:site-specific DNA-methyltransferase [Anaerolineae bacterium]
MSNEIYFGDNLPILRNLQSETVDLIYIDPPFNTKKTQKRTTVKTIQDKNGDRIGFKGQTYKTIELSTRAYEDSFESLVNFLRPRLVEAYRILSPHGSLYFHIDYREVHYCKILLDEIFGRESFLNEIIWAYDYGGRAKTKWPAKHDNILFYVKDPQRYVFNLKDVEREPYMAPGLVGAEKAQHGKTPTDTWWPTFTGTKSTRSPQDTWWFFFAKGQQNDTWWQTIVPTASKERVGYPTQKPRKLIDRIIKASSNKGDTVLDFFAGSGTVGESCLELGRQFVLIDNNRPSLEVMAQRFSKYSNIKWINFNPKPFQILKEEKSLPSTKQETLKLSEEYIMFVATSSALREELEETNELWSNSPFEWAVKLPPRKKGKLGGKLIASWLASKDLRIDTSKDSSETISINGHKIAIKFSTLWTNKTYKFQQIRSTGYEFVLCLGISPFEINCWIFERKYALEHAKKQHKGGAKSEYWITIDPKNPPEWAREHGGTLSQVYKLLKRLTQK